MSTITITCEFLTYAKFNNLRFGAKVSTPDHAILAKLMTRIRKLDDEAFNPLFHSPERGLMTLTCRPGRFERQTRNLERHDLCQLKFCIAKKCIDNKVYFNILLRDFRVIKRFDSDSELLDFQGLVSGDGLDEEHDV